MAPPRRRNEMDPFRTTPILLLLAALAATACGRQGDSDAVRASGHVEATDVRISTKVAGRLEKFPIDEGMVVRAGQEIARIDTTDIALVLAQARAETEQAAADLALRLAGARREDIAELESQIDSVRADLVGAERDLGRAQALLDKGSGTQKAADDARTRRDMIAAKLGAMKQSLARMKAGSRAEEIAASRARLAAMEARIAQLEQQMKDAEVASPLDGVVTEKLVEPGELLAAGAALVVVSDLARPWLTVYVGEPDLGKIRLGAAAEVRTDDAQVRQGTISFIASKAEFTPKNVQTRDERVKLVYKVKIALSNDDGLFKPGMPAEARLTGVGAAR